MDLIDRLREYASTRKGELADLITEAADALERQTCEDAVSRADVLETYADLYDVFEDSKAICKELHKVYDRINALPAVQPQRTCVNCGRTVNNGGWYADGRTRCPIEEHYALPKDGYCHLWEKRNVTDDDYPERRTDE